MNAAIYARLSVERDDVATESKSVVIQEEGARAFAIAKGWAINAAHVYVDDGVSGAEFKKRPSFQRLMAAARMSKPPFQVLIVSEQKSIGREMTETSMMIKTLAQAGVEIFEYVHGRSLTPKNYLEKGMSALQSMADEAHRAQTSERVITNFTRKAKLGHVVGGRYSAPHLRALRLGLRAQADCQATDQ